MFNLATGVILLSSKTILDTASLGFLFTFASGFSAAINNAVSEIGMLEGYMNSTKEILDYTELVTEDQGGIDVPESWPATGQVEVKDISLAYAPHLPLVLMDVSFKVDGGSTIGIVGRTGAGKVRSLLTSW